MLAGYYQVEAIFSSEQAVNSPQRLGVELWVIEVPKRTVPYVSPSPQPDGKVSESEYPQAAFIDVGQVAAGRSVGRMVHDGRYLYLGLTLADDPTADSADVLILLFDNDNDDRWPPQPADEGLYYFYAYGSTYFRPVYSNGEAMAFGEVQANPSGVLAVFGNQAGSRTIEVRIDLQESHLRRQMGEAFGFMLWYFDYAGGQYPLVGFWPQSAPEIDDAVFWDDMTLEVIPDALLAQPKELFFRQVQGSGLSEEQQIELSVTTSVPFQFFVEPSHNWIVASPLAGTTPAVVGVRADASSMSAGTYRGKLWIYAPGARNSPLAVNVTLEVVEPPPRFKLSPQSLLFSMREGGDLPPAQKISVSNAGGGKLNWRVHLAGDWLEASPLSGEDGGEVTVSVTTMPAGT